ncbi:MaoC/PaaZ C-terminal domain-containing protein [Novosphingobium pentaromativorans]|uniref:MaoC-like dehydratase n=1 Tax=Novosphingobium pentaromativorans US6-1 TaxID=1088721 RepID=G6ECL1_9SPHN|nr:MaoC/PaaZ C-terminal domain-containing protein [Novosphingobium pentaromativorans]AIT80025.1 hypothetical protein JI59_09670 [Novosphingobium pentaromativorans US6-1]EHJ60922.1 hypothetical protein NSU_2082 [Novosphingobium pentaromativorans US6-1]
MLAAEKLLAMPADVKRVDWSARDTIIYNLGIGCGAAAIEDEKKLRLVLEDRLAAFPTMATVMGMSLAIFARDFGIVYNGVLHGEEWITLHRPLPADGNFEVATRVEKIWDRGTEKGAILQTCKTIRRQGEGELIAETRTVLMLRKNGGFGGSAEGAPRVMAAPEREADTSITLETRPEQALIYRLSGDANPLHADPEVARKAGFPGPILHGMATYGVIARAVVDGVCAGDEQKLAGFGLRFSSPVYPGETLRTDIWTLGEGKFAFQATAVERNVLVAVGGQATVNK